MRQRLISPEELKSIGDVRRAAKNLPSDILSMSLVQAVAAFLDSVAANRTNDGFPWVEPKIPDIPKGFRLAIGGDEDRMDCLELDRETLEWTRRWRSRDSFLNARSRKFDPDVTYIVTTDSIPSDQDARRRPWVMVRQAPEHNWSKAILYGVSEGDNPFSAILLGDTAFGSWKHCRHIYQGE